MNSVRVVSYSAPCPECHEACEWCGLYRWQAREGGCGGLTPGGRKARCRKAAAVKGTECGTCTGSRKVMVRREILGEIENGNS